MAQPNRRDRTRPIELLAISGGLAIFVGLIALMSTRDLGLAGIFAVITFIIALVVLAMLVLAIRPDNAEQLDMTEQDREQDRKGH
jgi:membrane protein implicated in regulation of membrane protease activity